MYALALLFGTALANSRDELRNGRAEMIRATGAVLIASVLLYFWQLSILANPPKIKLKKRLTP